MSKVCYIIRNTKAYMSVSSLKVIYYSTFHSVMSYGIIFWGNSSHSHINFSVQKRQLELWKDLGADFHVETYLKFKNFEFDITIHVTFINVCGSKRKSLPDKQ